MKQNLEHTSYRLCHKISICNSNTKKMLKGLKITTHTGVILYNSTLTAGVDDYASYNLSNSSSESDDSSISSPESEKTDLESEKIGNSSDNDNNSNNNRLNNSKNSGTSITDQLNFDYFYNHHNKDDSSDKEK